MQFHDKLHNVFVELVLCRCVSQWQELTNQEKHTNAKCTSTQIQKYTLYLWTRRCATASPSDRNPLSSTTHNNQRFFSSVPECTPSYLLTDNPASATAITIASYANVLRPSKVLICLSLISLRSLDGLSLGRNYLIHLGIFANFTKGFTFSWYISEISNY